jgi:hypothetical protein
MITKNYGNITAEVAIRNILPGLNSGNLQAVIYDLTYQKVYFAYGYVTDNNQRINAYMRPYIGLNLKEIFAHKNS